MQLLSEAFRLPVEQIVSEHTRETWRVRSARDMTEFACHPCAIFSDGRYAVFVKFSDAANGLEQFTIELAGLRRLAERAGVLTPAALGTVTVAGGTLLVLEAVEAVDREARHWRQIGRTLARIHQVKGEQCGLETQGYFGPLDQDNRPMRDWPAFYAQRRLWPLLRMAIDSGNLPLATGRQVEKLIARVPQLCGPAVVPALLHGDAQQNNFISTERGAVVIDPAVFYGHPEYDLALVDYFQPVPDDVFDGYREIAPIDPGFGERRELWRAAGYLAAVTVEGAPYLNRLTEAVAKYL